MHERNAYITGLLANPNLDDGKNTKRNALENVDIDYQNILKSIYNSIDKNEIDFENDPFFKAMKIPGKDIPAEDTTVPDRTSELEQEIEIDVDQS